MGSAPRAGCRSRRIDPEQIAGLGAEFLIGGTDRAQRLEDDLAEGAARPCQLVGHLADAELCVARDVGVGRTRRLPFGLDVVALENRERDGVPRRAAALGAWWSGGEKSGTAAAPPAAPPPCRSRSTASANRPRIHSR